MLLDSRQFPVEVSRLASSSTQSVLLASAFIKESALKNILQTTKVNTPLTVISRWQMRDLISGSSDLTVYKLCRERGIPFGISLNFHGKLYMFDRREIFLGSANLTSRGFSIGSAGNIEFGTRFLATESDLLCIESFIKQDVVWLNDDVFSMIETEIEDAHKQLDNNAAASNLEWTDNVLSNLQSPVTGLWMEDLLFNTPEILMSQSSTSESVIHDMELLGLTDSHVNRNQIISSFKGTKFFRWLSSQVKDNPGINIGGLSTRLHDVLLDDPSPYRRDVKSMIVTAFSWLILMSEDYQVTQHSRTMSVVSL